MKIISIFILISAFLVSCGSSSQINLEATLRPSPNPILNTPSNISIVDNPIEKIVFVSEQTIDSYQISIINTDGSEMVTLVQDDFVSYSAPIWSPNGRKLVFQSSQIGSPVLEDIWIMNSDGTDKLNLTKDLAYSASPQWSPDGENIAFSSEYNGNIDIYLVNTSGSTLLRLTDYQGFDGRPAWSPDGRKIAFESDRNGETNIYSITVDNSDIVQLTKTIGGAHSPRWSSDGEKIAFILDNRVWIMNSDGSDKYSVADDINVDAFFPKLAWSPKANILLFTGQGPLDNFTNAYLLDILSQEITRITDDKQRYVHGSWSSDGAKISIIGELSQGAYGLYIINIDSSSTIELTDNLGLNCCADWQPLSSR